jgi:hypothetical protein
MTNADPPIIEESATHIIVRTDCYMESDGFHWPKY